MPSLNSYIRLVISFCLVSIAPLCQISLAMNTPPTSKTTTTTSSDASSTSLLPSIPGFNSTVISELNLSIFAHYVDRAFLPAFNSFYSPNALYFLNYPYHLTIMDPYHRPNAYLQRRARQYIRSQAFLTPSSSFWTWLLHHIDSKPNEHQPVLQFLSEQELSQYRVSLPHPLPKNILLLADLPENIGQGVWEYLFVITSQRIAYMIPTAEHNNVLQITGGKPVFAIGRVYYNVRTRQISGIDGRTNEYPHMSNARMEVVKHMFGLYKNTNIPSPEMFLWKGAYDFDGNIPKEFAPNAEEGKSQGTIIPGMTILETLNSMKKTGSDVEENSVNVNVNVNANNRLQRRQLLGGLSRLSSFIKSAKTSISNALKRISANPVIRVLIKMAMVVFKVGLITFGYFALFATLALLEYARIHDKPDFHAFLQMLMNGKTDGASKFGMGESDTDSDAEDDISRQQRAARRREEEDWYQAYYGHAADAASSSYPTETPASLPFYGPQCRNKEYMRVARDNFVLRWESLMSSVSQSGVRHVASEPLLDVIVPSPSGSLSSPPSLSSTPRRQPVKILSYNDIPWPVCNPNRDNLDLAHIQYFFFSGLDTSQLSQSKKALKKYLLFFHPDKFLARFGERLNETERERIVEGLMRVTEAVKLISTSSS